MRTIKSMAVTLVLAMVFTACATTGNKTPQQKREAIDDMKQEVLAELYKLHPHAESQVTASPGYAVFSNANINLLFASFGGGYGVVTDNQNGRRTYMNMGEVGIGIGLGVKDFRAVFILKDRHWNGSSSTAGNPAVTQMQRPKPPTRGPRWAEKPFWTASPFTN
jgi:hypothetical protein